ncbi:unnamed protein product, partial [Rotaria sp. Silwood2]
HDESCHNSTAIENIKMFINDNKDQSSMTDTEIKESSFSQLETLDKLQAVQLITARANERLTV